MPLRFDRRLTGLVLALAVLVAFAACGKKRPPVLATTPGGAGSSTATEPVDRTPARPVDEGPDVRAVRGEGTEGSDIAGSALGAGGEGGPLADIHFIYDSAALSDEARATLEKHALWLQGHRDVKVTVEGHCDARGTVEYNLALGEQRARAARDYLLSLGLAADRIRIVSYGKERPLDPADNEKAYATNRRARFAVYR
jgi:peptidoglycan-associated lipoprotein